MNSLQNTAKTKLAKTLKLILNETNYEKEIKSQKRAAYYEGASQERIPIKDVKNGIIITNDNRYLSVIELRSTHFDLQTPARQEEMLDAFAQIFQQNTKDWMFKIMNDIGDCKELIQNIQTKCLNKDDPEVQRSIQDHIEYIQNLVSNGDVVTRFFYIWEYSSENNEDKNDFNLISQIIQENKKSIIHSLQTVDENAIVLDYSNENSYIMEFLYKYFNRRSCINETVQERYARVIDDYKKYNLATGDNKTPTIADFIAPKGLYFMNRTYEVRDGLYYGYIGLSSNSWPDYEIPAGWINCFKFGPMVDVDVIGKQHPHEATKFILDQYNQAKTHSIKALVNKGKQARAERKNEELLNNQLVLNDMKAGNRLYDVCIILSVRATTLKQLKSYMRQIKWHMKHKLHMEPIDSFLCCEDFYTLTMPFLYLNKTFHRLAHNVLSNDLQSIYPLSTNRIYDPNGCAIGTTPDGSVAAINLFNTALAENANMAIFGTPGAGKTYTEQLIGHRMMLNGIRCFFIIPNKGYQYKKGCRLNGGLHIPLVPGSKYGINILALRPEASINESLIKDDTLISNKSLLAKKISSVLIWINLQLDTPMTTSEYNKTNVVLTNLYKRFGITDNNNSIYEDIYSKKLKSMPILGDFYNDVKAESGLERIVDVLIPYVSGTCQNLNQQTNVDLDNSYIVFDVEEDVIGQTLLPAFLYIAFDFCYSEIKANDRRKDTLILDEIWKMMKDKRSAEQLRDAVKLIRGYSGSVIVATQELKDLLSANAEYGMSILNCCATILFLKMKEIDLNLVKENFRINDEEYKSILGLKRKKGLLMYAGDKMKINILSSDYEHNFLTDNTGNDDPTYEDAA